MSDMMIILSKIHSDIVGKNLLRKCGISLEFVVSNFSEEENDPYYLKYQKDLIVSGKSSIISPFSGKKICGRKSFHHDDFCYYEFEDENQKVWLLCGFINMRFCKLAIITEGNAGNVFLISQKAERRLPKLAREIEFFVRNRSRFNKSNLPKQTALIIGFPHFFHHVLNELSALEKLLEDGLENRISKIFVLRSHFDLETLFPELSDKIKILRPKGNNFLGLQRYLVARPCGRFIKKSLVDRIYKYSAGSVSESFRKAALRFRSNHTVIVAISIRVGMNKNWSNCVEGIPRIINKLRSQNKDIGFIIDGLSLTGNYSAPRKGHERIIREQKKSIKYMLENTNESDCVWNLVGCRMEETIFLSRLVDTYLMAHGSQQHKWGWFGNAPGIVHGPRGRMLMEQDNVACSAYSMPDPVYCKHIPHTAISNSTSDLDPAHFYDHSDYTFDWNLAYDLLVKLIDKIREKPNRTPSEWNEILED